MNTIRVSNGLNSDQGRCSVCPDLGPNCLHLGYQQMTKVADTCSKERVKCKRLGLGLLVCVIMDVGPAKCVQMMVK